MISDWLNEDEERAWRTYRRMYTLLEACLAGELTDQTGLSMSDYTVLSNLVDAKDRRFRLSALAGQMKWSQSRLSHQIARMAQRGLVKKESVENDGRGAFVVMTPDGFRALAAASPTHMKGVREHMMDLLTPGQVGALEEISGIVVQHLEDEPGRGEPPE